MRYENVQYHHNSPGIVSFQESTAKAIRVLSDLAAQHRWLMADDG